MASDKKLVEKIQKLETELKEAKTVGKSLKEDNERLLKVEVKHGELEALLTTSKNTEVTLSNQVKELEKEKEELTSGSAQKDSESKILDLKNEIEGLKHKLEKHGGPFPKNVQVNNVKGNGVIVSAVIDEDGNKVELHRVGIGNDGVILLQTKTKNGKCEDAEFLR